MFPWPVSHLLQVRRVLLYLLGITGCLTVVACSILLVFQLTKTSGYTTPIPGILAAGFLSTVLGPYLILSRPMGKGRLAIFFRSIAFELLSYAGLSTLVLIGTANLHADTPGLLTDCGGFAVCKMLAAVLVTGWLQFLWLGLLLVELTFSTFYLKVARSHPIQPFVTAVDEVRWNTYAKRPRRSFIMLRREGQDAPAEMGDDVVLDLSGAEWKTGAEEEEEMKTQEQGEKRFL